MQQQHPHICSSRLLRRPKRHCEHGCLDLWCRKEAPGWWRWNLSVSCVWHWAAKETWQPPRLTFQGYCGLIQSKTAAEGGTTSGFLFGHESVFWGIWWPLVNTVLVLGSQKKKKKQKGFLSKAEAQQSPHDVIRCVQVTAQRENTFNRATTTCLRPDDAAAVKHFGDITTNVILFWTTEGLWRADALKTTLHISFLSERNDNPVPKTGKSSD